MKQDRIHPRTAVDLQRKYGRKVANTAVVAEDAAKEATQAAASAESAAKAAAEATKDLTELEAKLELTLKVNENGEVISEINGVANVIKFLANCISIQSDKFKLAEDGTVEINGGSICIDTKNGRIKIGESFENLSIETDTGFYGSGCSLGITPNTILFKATEEGIGTIPIMFDYSDGAYKNRLLGDWYVGYGNVTLADLVSRIEALEGKV